MSQLLPGVVQESRCQDGICGSIIHDLASNEVPITGHEWSTDGPWHNAVVNRVTSGELGWYMNGRERLVGAICQVVEIYGGNSNSKAWVAIAKLS